MKVRSLLLAASLALLVASPALATGSHRFGIQGGTSVPSGDFGDAANAGYNVGGLYQYTITSFGIGAELMYHAWGASETMNTSAETLFGAGSEYTHSAWQYGVFGTYSMQMASVQPYAKLALGFYSPGTRLKTPSGESSVSDTNFGTAFGLGADFDTPSSMKIGVGAMYHRLKESQVDFVSADVRFVWPLNFGAGQ